MPSEVRNHVLGDADQWGTQWGENRGNGRPQEDDYGRTWDADLQLALPQCSGCCQRRGHRGQTSTVALILLHLCGPPGSAWVAGYGLESCYWGAEQEVGLALVAAPGAAVCPFLIGGRIRLSAGAWHLPSGIIQATPGPRPAPREPRQAGKSGARTQAPA